jgi:hypothetical protein
MKVAQWVVPTIPVGTTHHFITQREEIPLQKYRPWETMLDTVLRGHIQGDCHCAKQSLTKRLTNRLTVEVMEPGMVCIHRLTILAAILHRVSMMGTKRERAYCVTDTPTGDD